MRWSHVEPRQNTGYPLTRLPVVPFTDADDIDEVKTMFVACIQEKPDRLNIPFPRCEMESILGEIPV